MIITQDHALVKQALEWFLVWNRADIIKEQIPKTRVQQMQHGMFGPADIKVHWHPLLELVIISQGLFVMWIDKAQEVPRRTGPLRHGVRLPLTFTAILVHNIDPVCQIGERALTGSAWLDINFFRQSQRQFIFWYQGCLAIFPMNHWNRFAPITLPGKDPVTQLIVNFCLANAFIFQPCDHPINGILFV